MKKGAAGESGGFVNGQRLTENSSPLRMQLDIFFTVSAAVFGPCRKRQFLLMTSSGE